MGSYNGQILRPLHASAFSFPDHLKKLPEVQNWNAVAGTSWHRFFIESSVPLTTQDLEAGRTPPYRYQLLTRWGGENLIVAAEQKEVTQHFLKQVLPSMQTRMHAQKIHVDNLVRTLVTNPDIYTTTFLHARVSAFGTSLRSVSMYGDDITSTNLVLDNLGMFGFQNCGIGGAESGREIVRVSNNGSITFSAYSEAHFTSLDRFLKFLKVGDFYIR